jgi:hypothetical protein
VSEQAVLAVVCAAADGKPYEGRHLIGKDGGYIVITPRGQLIRCCDSDCVVRFLEWESNQQLKGAA